MYKYTNNYVLYLRSVECGTDIVVGIVITQVVYAVYDGRSRVYDVGSGVT